MLVLHRPIEPTTHSGHPELMRRLQKWGSSKRPNNLIMNAIEAMSSVTGRERRLTVGSCLDQPATLTITVEDTGIGINAAHFDRIFDPLFTTKSHGMGLGLSICRSIIETHGGRAFSSAMAYCRPAGLT